jgi:hypothetical protein
LLCQLLQRLVGTHVVAAHCCLDLSQRDSNTSPEHALTIVAVIMAGADNIETIEKSSAPSLAGD